MDQPSPILLRIPTASDIWDTLRSQLWPETSESELDPMNELVNFLMSTPDPDSSTMQAILEATAIFEYLGLFMVTMMIAWIIFATGSGLMTQTKAIIVGVKTLIVAAVIEANQVILFEFYSIIDDVTEAFLVLETNTGGAESAGEFATNLVMLGAEMFAVYGLVLQLVGFTISMLSFLFLLIVLWARYYILLAGPLVFPIAALVWPLRDLANGRFASTPGKILTYLTSALLIAPLIAVVILVSTTIASSDAGVFSSPSVSVFINSVSLFVGVFVALKMSTAGRQLLGMASSAVKTGAMIGGAAALGGTALAARTAVASQGGVGALPLGNAVGERIAPGDAEVDPSQDGEGVPRPDSASDTAQELPQDRADTTDQSDIPSVPTESLPDDVTAQEIDYEYGDNTGAIPDSAINADVDEAYQGRYMTDETIEKQGMELSETAEKGRDAHLPSTTFEKLKSSVGMREDPLPGKTNVGDLQTPDELTYEGVNAAASEEISRGDAIETDLNQATFTELEEFTTDEKQVGILQDGDGQAVYQTSLDEKRLEDGETYEFENAAVSPDGNITADEYTSVEKGATLFSGLSGAGGAGSVISQGRSPDDIYPLRRQQVDSLFEDPARYAGNRVSLQDSGSLSLLDPSDSSQLGGLPDGAEAVGEFTTEGGDSIMVSFSDREVAEKAAQPTDTPMTFDNATVETMSAHSDRNIYSASAEGNNTEPILQIDRGDDITRGYDELATDSEGWYLTPGDSYDPATEEQSYPPEEFHNEPRSPQEQIDRRNDELADRAAGEAADRYQEVSPDDINEFFKG